MSGFFTPVANIFRRRKRENALAQAATWPTITAKLLKSTVLEKDSLAEEGTAFQDRQIESAFYFIHQDNYYGGFLRSTPLSDSEAHRILRVVTEDTKVTVRFNPANPDQTHTLASDNPGALPFTIWDN